MSATKSIHPDEKFKADKLGRSLVKFGLLAGGALMILSITLGAFAGDSNADKAAGLVGNGHWRRFFYAYLVGWSFILSITIGALFFIMIHHIARARYGIVLRRLCEFIVGAFPVVALLGLGFVIPVLAGYKDLYFWTRPEVHDASHRWLYDHMHHKATWLSPWFFSLRYVIYFAIYIGLATWFKRTSAAQDDSGDPALSDKMRVASGPCLIIAALTTVFVGMDVFMTLSPTWYSTIYSVNYFAGGMLAIYCVLALLARYIQSTGRLTHSVSVEHYHDIGKYMFGWTFFWIYTAFSQFMLQWYGNMPEETVFYDYRLFGGWVTVSWMVLLGQWAFPYLALVTRWTKRILPFLMFFAVWQLVFHWVDLYWNIMPNLEWSRAGTMGPLMGDPTTHGIGFAYVDVTVSLALIGLFIAGIGRAMRGNLMPIKDPKLGACLAFENY